MITQEMVEAIVQERTRELAELRRQQDARSLLLLPHRARAPNTRQRIVVRLLCGLRRLRPGSAHAARDAVDLRPSRSSL